MNAKVTLGPAGRLVIPKAMRDSLHLATGDTLDLKSEGEQIVVRPLHTPGTMRKEKGMWVFYTGKPIKPGLIDHVRQQILDERDAQNLGRP